MDLNQIYNLVERPLTMQELIERMRARLGTDSRRAMIEDLATLAGCEIRTFYNWLEGNYKSTDGPLLRLIRLIDACLDINVPPAQTPSPARPPAPAVRPPNLARESLPSKGAS